MNTFSYYLLKKITNYAKYLGITNYISNNYDFYINQVDKHLWVSNLPTIQHKNKIKHINTIISFLSNDEYGNEQTNWIDKTDKKYYRIPVSDYTAPSKEDYNKLLKIIQQEKGNILIHCYAGKGRSNCGACIYMMAKHNLPADKAIKHIQSHIPRSRMNRWQQQSVMDFTFSS